MAPANVLLLPTPRQQQPDLRSTHYRATLFIPKRSGLERDCRLLQRLAAGTGRGVRPRSLRRHPEHSRLSGGLDASFEEYQPVPGASIPLWHHLPDSRRSDTDYPHAAVEPQARLLEGPHGVAAEAAYGTSGGKNPQSPAHSHFMGPGMLWTKRLTFPTLGCIITAQAVFTIRLFLRRAGAA